MANNSGAVEWDLEGVHLVEASAGTGKTYNIQTLFARFVIEKSLPVDSILVVTFTEAATKELINRIRRILKNLLHYIKTGENRDNQERIPELVVQAVDQKNITKHAIRKRVDRALNDFDDAAIYTIHGFCNRILQDAAFETGALFDTQLIEDPAEIIDDVLADFYRENFYSASTFTNQLLQVKNLELSNLRDFIKGVNTSLNPRFIPSNLNISLDTGDIEQELKNVKRVWEREIIIEKLKDKMKKDYRGDRLNKKIENIEKLIAGNINSDTLAVIEDFTNEKIAGATFSKVEEHEIPSDKFFDLCDSLNTKINNFSYSVRLKCYQYYQKRFKQHKQQQNMKTYDDMIEEVRRRVQSPDSRLSRYIRRRYKIALVDEFQDTSPAQYEIFKKVFINGDRPIYFVGDPKQAIYKFRGGDIYTYNTAKNSILPQNKHTLGKNWRSLPNLVSVFNFLFSDKMGAYPFANKFINYEAVRSRSFSCIRHLSYQGKEEHKPFKILFRDKKTSTRQMTEFATRQTAEQIFQLLNNNDYQIGEGDSRRNLRPEDIAILVDKHSTAEIVKNELNKWNIAVTIQATGNIFATEEARDIQLLLTAINNPRNLRYVKAVLSTKLFPVDCKTMIKYSEEEDTAEQKEFEDWLKVIRNCQKIWRENNFIEMLYYFIERIDLRNNLLSMPDGERILTNFYHLSELVHRQEEKSKVGINGMLKWLQKKCEQSGGASEDEKLRLETDRSAVQVMTIHRSKGLEFPIVFCPFLWSRTVYLYNENSKFHDNEGNYFIDLTDAEKYKKLARDENLEELMRLLYVALTRAEAQCYIVWGKLQGRSGSKKKKSALAYLFHRNKIQEQEFKKGCISDKIANIITKQNYKPDHENLDNHIELIDSLDDEIEISHYERKTKTLPEKITDFSGETEINWYVSSFSNIVEHESNQYEYYDYDKLDHEPIQESEQQNEYTIFNFPGGVKTGNCWHKIFEELDFQMDYQGINEIVEEKLSLYNLVSSDEEKNIKERKIQIVSNMVSAVLNAKLNKKELKLKKINEENKIAELEFALSLKDLIDIDMLNQIFVEFGYNIKLQNNIPEGMLKGFIDLIFRWQDKYYLLDWKSNKIAENYTGYNRNNLETEMENNNYHLQYLIYTVALIKHLSDRLGDIDYQQVFGGVYYIFLRGVQDNNEGNGIYFDLPDKKLIEKLSAIF